MMLKPGWNLISPVADCPVPSHDGIVAPLYCWDADTQAYQAVPPDGTLECGKGYWVYLGSNDGCVVHIGD